MKYSIHEYKKYDIEITPQILRDLLIKFFAQKLHISPVNEEEFIQLLLKLESIDEVSFYLKKFSNLDHYKIKNILEIYQFIKSYDKLISLTRVHQWMIMNKIINGKNFAIVD